MGFARDLHQHGGGVVGGRCIPFEQLARGHDDLVRGLAPAAAAPHAVGHDTEHTAVGAAMAEQFHAVLLVIAVTLVDAGGCGQSIPIGHFAPFNSI